MTLLFAVVAAGALSLMSASTRPTARLPFEPRTGRSTMSVQRRAARRHPRSGVRVGLILLGAAVAAAIGSAIGVVVFAAAALMPVLRSRRRDRNKTSGLSVSLAEAIDLFAVALHSGHNLPNATRQVAEWAQGDVGDALRWCCRQVDHGHRLTDVLEVLPDRIGPPVRPLVAALIAHERHGAPVGQALSVLAADARADRRRHAESAARKLPVALLFPLVVCVLPALLLLTVVPVIAEALASFTI